MKAIERLYQYIEYKGLKPTNLEKKIGLSSGYLSIQRKRNADIGETVLNKINDYCHDVNIEWLLTGNGEMIKTKDEKNLTISDGKINGKENSNKQKVKKNLPKLIESISGIPLIPIDAMAGFGSGETQIMEYDAGRYVVPEFTEINVDFMIRVKGSSMSPKYSSGDLVACKKLYLNDIFFQWNKVYVLDTDQGALIKRVRKGNDIEHISLVSENQSYDPFELHLSKVYAVALVVGVIRLE